MTGPLGSVLAPCQRFLGALSSGRHCFDKPGVSLDLVVDTVAKDTNSAAVLECLSGGDLVATVLYR